MYPREPLRYSVLGELVWFHLSSQLLASLTLNLFLLGCFCTVSFLHPVFFKDCNPSPITSPKYLLRMLCGKEKDPIREAETEEVMKSACSPKAPPYSGSQLT